jgi:hypothetical protein
VFLLLSKTIRVCSIVSLIFVLSAGSTFAARLFPDSYYEDEYCPSNPKTDICIEFYKDTGKTPTGEKADNNKVDQKTEIKESDIEVVVNGEKLTLEPKPLVVKGTTLVPLRQIFKALGAAVEWDEGLQLVTANNGKTEIRIGIGQPVAFINNEKKPVAIPAQKYKGYTYVPARFIAESFGADVKFDKESNTVIITSEVLE